jgi:aminoglycoside phosphotransferase (APT) family kinase protein
MIAPHNPTTDGLLAALRHHTSRPTMAWSVPPAPLAGGFWAELYVVELADAPSELRGRLVARVMPNPDTAAFETAVHRHLTRCRFPVPTIRCAARPSGDLDRAWSLMDFAAGQPMLAGLRAGTAIKLVPAIARRLPDLLAEAAATLHLCPVDGLEEELSGHVRRADISDFLERVATQADAAGRPDLARTADRLAATANDARVICHGDLHPFNLLVDGDEWTLIDWSTAVLADPHYDLGFTTLMLANPPLGGPAPVRAAIRAIGSRLANRFLRSYEQRTGRPVDAERLAWGQQAHALRALVEVATWEANDGLDARRGHPWLTMRPVLEAHLAGCCATMAATPSTEPHGGST